MKPHSRQNPVLGKRQTRFLTNKQPIVDVESRTVQLSFSSCSPVPRAFGSEVLSHQPGAADLSRLNSRAPLLFNHNADDVLGVVESAAIGSDGKGRAVVRFGSDARGEWAMAQVDDGILSNVSFTYSVDDYEQGAGPDGDALFTALRWTAYEISIVTVPADTSVGVGRSLQLRAQTTMDQDLQDQETDSRLSRRQRAAHNVEAERDRITGIHALCRQHGLQSDLETQLVNDGTSLQDARGLVLSRMLARGQQPVASMSSDSSPGFIGLNDREVRNFSLVRAVNAIVSGDWSQAGFERQCSQAVQQQLGRPPAARAFFVPLEVQQRTPWLSAQRQTRAPYLVGTAAQGGNLVATNLMADQFIDALRNSSQVLQAGAMILPGLVGNIDIPRRVTTTGTAWVGESTALTEAESTFDKVSLRPKTIGAFSKMSRLMLLQATPAIEQLARNDLMLQLGLGIDLAALSGSGSSSQPTGVANTGGIGSVVGGANGLAVTLDHVIALESALSNSNAPWDTRGYLFNTKTIGTLKGLKASTGAYLWTSAPNGNRSGTPPDINGYPLFASNQARSNLTKGTSSGVCSELFFGAWSELIIGQWGVLEVLVNPYDATGFLNGDVLIRAMQTVDIAVKHAGSFATMADALTP